MPRRKKNILKRDIGVDPRYGSQMIQKLINIVTKDGKKSIARTIVYDAINLLIKKNQGDKNKALDLFYKGFEQLVPLVEVRPRRVGGSVYQIPMEVNQDRGRALAMRWLIESAAARSDKDMGTRLAYELIEASEGRGGAVKKKLDVHRMAEANRAFSHLSW